MQPKYPEISPIYRNPHIPDMGAYWRYDIVHQSSYPRRGLYIYIYIYIYIYKPIGGSRILYLKLNMDLFSDDHGAKSLQKNIPNQTKVKWSPFSLTATLVVRAAGKAGCKGNLVY